MIFRPLALVEEASEAVALSRTEVGIGVSGAESSMERVGGRWRYRA